MTDEAVIDDSNSLLDPNREDPNISEESKSEAEIESKESETLPEVDSEELSDEKNDDDLPLPDAAEEKNSLPKWAEKRLSKKDREIAELKHLLEEQQIRASNQPAYGVQPENLPAPNREDFESEDDYIDARFAYNQRKSFQEQAVRDEERYIQERENQFRNNWKSAFEEGVGKYEDFEDKADILNRRDFPANRAMAEAIVDSPYKVDILYFLGTYADKAKEYAKLNPIKAVKKIAELEARFAERSKTKSTTKAPPPHNPIKGNKGMAGEGDPAKMEPHDFSAWYQAKYGNK